MLFVAFLQLIALANVCLVLVAASHKGRHDFTSTGEIASGNLDKSDDEARQIRIGKRFRNRWQETLHKPEILDEVLGLAGLPRDCGGFLLRRQGFTNQTSKVRVEGGSNTYANSFPSFAYLPGPRNGFCGGTIIHKRYILTAAHCFKRNDGSSKFKQVGLGSVKTMDNLMEADRICINTYYNGGFMDDLAILRLPRDITFDRFTQPACLPDTEPDSEEMDRLSTLGMGRMDENQVSYELQVLETKWADCHEDTRPEIICYADRKSQGGRVCKGDSGSGTFFERNGRQYLLAVLSGASDINCGNGNQGAFAIGGDVFHQRSVIDRMLKACGTLGGPPPEDRARLRSLGFNPADDRLVFV